MAGVALMLIASACASNEGEDAEPRSAPQESPAPTEEDNPAEGNDSDGEPSDGDAKPTTKRAQVVDTAFDPDDITVAAGSTIVWKQTGLQAHSVTAADESFDSSPGCTPIKTDECLAEGDVFRFKFKEPGAYDYYCRVHGLPDGTGMAGTITVEG